MVHVPDSGRPMERRSPRWLLVVRSSLAAALFGVSFAASIPSANASACPGTGAPFNTVFSPSTNGRGDKVSTMLVEDGTVTCGRVSSLIDHNSAYTSFVEIGWVENPAGAYTCVPVTTGPPTLLAFASVNGMASCAGSRSVSTGSRSVSDPNGDGSWQYMDHGVLVFTANTGTFFTGVEEDNGERLNFDNTAHADFNGLMRMGSSKTWVSWTGTALNAQESDDSGSHGCFYSDTHTAVKLIGTAC